MALIIALRNTSGCAPRSNYEYAVYINETVIETGTVSGHYRHKGWADLVKRMLRQRRAKIVEEASRENLPPRA